MPDLPTGTVTFLFTDIEGSTRLWEQHPQAMEAALTRHDALAAEIIARCGGTLVKHRGEGDSLFAVFARAVDAVVAATELQRALATEAWPAGVELRVRMALHTGDATLRDGDYFGPAVNRCSRLRAAAHGGQVLLSQATRDLTRDNLPPEVSLRDLGSHRLRDLQEPEHLFMLLHPALPTDFPPLRSLEAFSHNLPRQLTSFIGREREMAELKRLLETTALLTLTGAGGCGKTRVTLQVAADLVEEFADGVWLVELAALADPELVPQMVAATLGVREEPGRPLGATLTDYLRTRSLLLILDNCEHLLSACARLAESLLRAGPGLKVLASSREGLGIAGETTYRLPSLSSPDPHAVPPTVEGLTQYEAVRLFLDRARAALPSFTVNSENAPAVAQVCRRLDGIPLAIELAAARVRALPVEKIAERLDDRFRLLTGGSRTALPRQQTLRALIDWSYELLSAPERTLLRRLSVFAGGWTLEAAEAVCAGGASVKREALSVETDLLNAQRSTLNAPLEEGPVLDLLTALVEKSLVQFEEQGGEARYRLLETVRQYARDRLLESSEAETLRGCHCSYFLQLAEEAEANLSGPEQVAWLERLELEHDNMRAALRWMRETGDAQHGLRLGAALSPFRSVRGYWTEARADLVELLSMSGASDRTVARSKALRAACWPTIQLGDRSSILPWLEESLEISRELEDQEGLASSLHWRARMVHGHGELSEAQALYGQSLAIARERGDRQGVAQSLYGLGNLAMSQGNLPVARSLYQESLAESRAQGDRQGIALALNNLGLVAAMGADYAAARPVFEEVLAIYQEIGYRWGIALALHNQGGVVQQQGEYEAARLLYEESLAIRRELGNQVLIPRLLNLLGELAQQRGDDGGARTLHEEALELSREFAGVSVYDTARSLQNLGDLARHQGDYETALARCEESVALWRGTGNIWLLAESLNSLGAARRESGDFQGAHGAHIESLAIYREFGNAWGVACGLEGLAMLAVSGDLARAARLFGCAAGLREACGAPLPPAERHGYERAVAATHAGLGEKAFTAAWVEGRAMPMEQTIAYALEDTSDA